MLLILFTVLCFDNHTSYVNKVQYSAKLIEINLIDRTPIIAPIKIKKSLYEIHKATWYNLHGRLTASGEKFHKDSLTAAYNNAEFGTEIRVTNLNNNESIIVKVTDRMGNSRSNRIDLSRSAFDSISQTRIGKIKVKLEII